MMFGLYKMRSSVFVVVILSTFYFSTTRASCGDSEYLHNGRCCRKCPMGFFVKEHCGANTPQTMCQPCENGTFEEEANSNINCKPCYRCQPARILKRSCNATTDTKCQCAAPDQFFSGSVDACILCKVCPAGKFPQRPCRNTYCRKCPQGYFSNRTKNYKFGCSKHRTCIKYKRNGNTTHDAVCSDVRLKSIAAISTTAASTSEVITTRKKYENDRSAGDSFDSAQVIVIIVVVAFVVFGFPFFTICFIARRRKAPCQRPRMRPSVLNDEIIYKTLSTGSLLRDQGATLLLKLAEMLNPDLSPNWRELAAELDFKYMEISNMAVDRKRSAEIMLGTWQTKENATVDYLYRSLIKIGRNDAANFLHDNVIQESLV